MTEPKIYIYSNPIRSGKTTLLYQWLDSQKKAYGFLTPDIDGKRKLFDISSKSYLDFELDENATSENKISIGRFDFDSAVFKRAQEILLSGKDKDNDWTIVDEVGKLELNQSGLEPALSSVIKHFQSGKANGKLILVIRDYILENCIKHYNLYDAKIIGNSFFSQRHQYFLSKTECSALILCGGHSMRMGKDKSMLEYYGVPQRYYLYNRLKQICNDVYISCNQEQAKSIPEFYNVVVDSTKYSDVGPMGGLLSAFEKYPSRSFLVVGCDYPFITMYDLLQLMENRVALPKAVCFQNPRTNFNEPLLTVYENECYPLLLEKFRKQKFSLRDFLHESNPDMLAPYTSQRVKSVDTMEDYLVSKEILNY